MRSSGGSWRSGRELISTATFRSAHAAKTASASNSDCGRLPRLPSTSRPVMWPNTLSVRVVERPEHPPRHRRAVGAELRVHARHHDVEPVEHLGRLVERAVLEDVDLDAREQAVAVRSLVDRRDDLELRLEPLDGEAVRDRQMRGVVGERRGTRGRAAARPRPSARSGCVPSDHSLWRVEVAAQLGQQGAALGRGLLVRAVAEVLQVAGHAALERTAG